MTAMLAFLGRFGPQAMAAGVFIGLFIPVLSDLLRPVLPASVWLLLVISFLRVKTKEIKAELSRPVLPFTVSIWMLVGTPALVTVLLLPFDFRLGIEAGMVLAAASSSLFSTPVLGAMFGLNGALLLVVLVVGTFLVPLTLPLAAIVFLGFDMGAAPAELMTRMAVFVLSALISATVIRKVFGSRKIDNTSEQIDGIAVILLVVFAVGVMQGLGARFVTDTWDTFVVTGLAFAVYAGMIVVGALGARVLMGKDRRRDVLSVGFICGTRNLAMIIAILPPGVDPDIPLFFAVGQFPIYIMPMLLGPVFRRLLRAG